MTGVREAADTPEALPECLTHCCDCGRPFSELVEDWEEYFADIEDVAFACAECGEREGYPKP